jgi:hypothetical protein
MFQVIFAITLFASIAMMVREGLWSNTIALFNIIISGLVAYGLYPPLTIWIDEMLDGKWTYVLDFLLVWIVFCVAMIICRVATGFASRTRLRFRHPIDPIGGPLVAALAAYALAAFATSTLYMAPLPKTAFGNRLERAAAELDANHQDAYSKGRAVTAWPDLNWLRFVETMSGKQAFGSSGSPAFSPKRFIAAHMVHRQNLETATAPWLAVTR